MSEETITITIGGPQSDKVLAEVRGVQRQLHLTPSEAVAMIMGYGIAAMTQQGVIGGRFSTPMSRAQMLREMQEMIATAEEFEQ